MFKNDSRLLFVFTVLLKKISIYIDILVMSIEKIKCREKQHMQTTWKIMTSFLFMFKGNCNKINGNIIWYYSQAFVFPFYFFFLFFSQKWNTQAGSFRWDHKCIRILNVIIIIISRSQSTAEHRPLQLLTISFDLRLLASSFCLPSCVNRHSTWPEGVLH
jgi:nucleoside recognition membrane protein YjiH